MEPIPNADALLTRDGNADFFESLSDGYLSVDANWLITYINAKGEFVSRRRRKDILGKHLFDVFPEAKATPFEVSFTKVMQTRQADIIEDYYGPQEGWVEVNIHPGKDGGLTFFYRDITSRKRMEILIECQREAMESALSGYSLKSTLEILVKAVESQSGNGALASILLLDDDGQYLVHGSAPSLPLEYCEAIDGIKIGENVGSCGTAAYTKKLVVVDDIAIDPRWADYKDVALKHNLHACWSLPIFSQNNNVLGTFAVYYLKPNIIGTTDHDVIEILSRTAAIVIERDKQNNRRQAQEGVIQQGEERLKQQQRLYETVLSNTPDFVYIIDREGRFTYVNDALSTMWGVENPVGKNFYELGYETWHADMHHREVNEVIQTKKPIRGEIPFTGTNGKRIYDYIFHPVFGDDGNVEAIAGTTRDVTDRKASEDELRDAAKRQSLLAAIVASSDDAIISKDLNGNITSWNPGAERVFGYTADEAIGKHISILIPHDKLDEENYIIGQIKSGNRVDHFETQRLHKDGKLLMVSVTVSPVKLQDGTIVGASKVARDITELKSTAEALKQSESKWRTLTEAMPQLVWMCKAEGDCTYLSRQWEDYTGIPVDQLLGFEWLNLLHPEDRERTEEAWSDAVADRADYNIEYRLRQHDGEYRWFKTRGEPLRDESGKIAMWCGTCTDIQEQVDARQMAESANQAKTEFLANMSHEIRTPMNAAIGLAYILESSQPLTEKQKEYIKTLQLSADSLLALINDLLDISKIEARTLELESIPFSLTELTQEVINMLSVRASEKGLALTSDTEHIKQQMFLGDPTRLRQIIMNLCSNAIKFTEQGGIHLSFTCEPTAHADTQTIKIAVKDSGIGIAEHKLEDIFQKFVQADASISRKFGGTGLGLAITKTLIEIMGGDITVESKLGEGSTFTICLPLRMTKEMPQEITTTPPIKIEKPEKLLGSPRVLLVEDYAANILVASIFLEQCGYSYDLAKNGIEAIEKATAGNYFVILMDVQMHDMDGFEATRLIREYEKSSDKSRALIIGMTAHALAGDRERCLAVGMDDYISKPFDHKVLAIKLAAARENLSSVA